MFADRPGPFEGRYHRLTDTCCRPLPLPGCGLPVVVGGDLRHRPRAASGLRQADAALDGRTAKR
jgi:hypothetical protein